jgi:hypothetical protein
MLLARNSDLSNGFILNLHLIIIMLCCVEDNVMKRSYKNRTNPAKFVSHNIRYVSTYSFIFPCESEL